MADRIIIKHITGMCIFSIKLISCDYTVSPILTIFFTKHVELNSYYMC